ncbi:RDD family protein [Kaistella flava (ex Peng et al. 2021)]|uniref:RDD family protein n=1 Tax=Kaistella flava (ex Peng et al. 2021) TaxID=2038776 RepID=A0A7M2YA31_9FLAO|nr:RDD family protein [Kaistella flava (ex Peng et al. 2021)]QOW10669.1 RDD family protein [Kaistella flava (ex Peng et al. 2021)]
MARVLQVVERHKADKGYRFLNYIIDLAFAMVIIWALILAFVLAKYFIMGADIEQSIDQISDMNPLIDRIGTVLMCSFILFLVEKFSNGRSLGKLITGTKVVKADGSELTTDDLLKRNFTRAVPFDQLSFLGNSGWHDNWSNTRVVRVKDYELARNMQNDIESLGIKENI